MVTLNSADSALKSFYLEAVTDSLNMKTNPLLAAIERSSASVVGKDVRKLVRNGFNGGVSAGTETGELPAAGDGNYFQFVTTLKNLYGTIEISDKAIRASANNEGAFVNLLNEEMQSLVKSASFNFGRMLYGDGNGILAVILSVADGKFEVNSVDNIFEGMYLDIMQDGTFTDGFVRRKVVAVDRATNNVTLDVSDLSALDMGATLYVHGSYGNEISGLGLLFSEQRLYGQERTSSFMKPYMSYATGDIDENKIQKAIDTIEANSGSKINFIVCSWGVRRALVNHMKESRVAMADMVLEGGYRALSFNGIPVVVDRFCPANTMFLLNTDDFKLHQLCDWQWLEAEDGKILKQVPGKAVYTATLVKYAELMCERPCGQGLLAGITEA